MLFENSTCERSGGGENPGDPSKTENNQMNTVICQPDDGAICGKSHQQKFGFLTLLENGLFESVFLGYYERRFP